MKKTIILFLLAAVMVMAFPFTCAGSGTTAGKVIYVCDDGSDAFTGASDTRPVQTLRKAFELLYDGGTCVICGVLTAPSGFQTPETAGTVTVTSVYGGVDYRKTEKATFKTGYNVYLEGSIVFRDLTITSSMKNQLFVCNGNRIVFDTGIKCVAAGGGTLPTIYGSGVTNHEYGGAMLTVNSGNWYKIRGGGRSYAKVAGDTVIEINGGSFENVIDCCGSTKQEGSVYVLVTGGSFSAGFRALSDGDLDGNIYIAVSGNPEFKGGMNMSAGGQCTGKCVVAVKGGVIKSFNGRYRSFEGGTDVYASDTRIFSDVSSRNESGTDSKYSEIEGAVREKLALLDSRISDSVEAYRASYSVNSIGEKTAQTVSSEHSLPQEEENVRTRSSVLPAVMFGVAAVAAVAGIVMLLLRKKAGFIFIAAALLFAAAGIILIVKRGSGSDEPPDAGQDVVLTDGNSYELYGNASVKGAEIECDGGFAVLVPFAEKNKEINFSVRTGDLPGRFHIISERNYEDGRLSFDGYYLEFDPALRQISFFKTDDNYRYLLGYRKCDIRPGETYQCSVRYRDRFLYVYFNENPLDTDPFFKFETGYKKDTLMLAYSGSAVFSDAVIRDTETVLTKETLTYSNPIINGMTDPEMFWYEGKYYLYGTRTTDSNNLYCYTSENGVDFTDAGIVMKGKDVWGESVFKAANILYRDGWFYMFYMANPEPNAGGDAVTSYASSRSPLGPFTSEKKETLSASVRQIGGQPFVDEDGKVYLVVTRFTPGNVTWLVEIECGEGKVKLLEKSAVKLLEATEKWENAMAPVLECGYIIKHKGLYYLIYAGGNYNSTYGVGYAVSENVRGPYEKYEFNPVMTWTDAAYGNGAASVFPSPDGTEYFITYLRHNSSSAVRPLNTCIDRLRFVPGRDGRDVISMSCPTVSKQPAPSSSGEGTAGVYRRFIDE